MGSRYDISIPNNFLNGVESCEVQILYDTSSSDIFTFLENIFLPITLVLMQSYPKIKNMSYIEKFILDISSSRPAPNKLSIWISKLLFGTNPRQEFSGWAQIYRSQYAFRCKHCKDMKIKEDQWNFVCSTKTVFPVLLSNKGVETVIKSFWIEEGVTENFILALLPARWTTEPPQVCKIRSGRSFATFYGTYDCIFMYDNKILKEYSALATIPQIWTVEYFSLEESGIRHEIRMKIIPQRSFNPFSRNGSISIPLYMAVAIVAATNSSLEIEANGRFPKIVIETAGVGPDMLWDGDLYEFVYTDGYQFLSCYAESYLTFEFYWMPFKPML
ncbi:hypothetical protein Fcan01_11510 [Folsomia candida]|uniref:Uncharacterized protein n=1 Tax=Folsomia candida TaxID=158441 RepID=A0A226E8A1_FOLCA|nr:hypothetical protein Fcan01_11510 [Folsomia candida]